MAEPDVPAYYQDRYLTELVTKIRDIGEAYIILEDTIFYPEGGGQPGDQGTLLVDGKTLSIIDTKKINNQIAHFLSDTSDLVVGMNVTLNLNWNRRYAHMKMHTALHLLGSLIPVSITGGSVGEQKSRLDFNVGDLKLEKEQLTQQLNELISTDSPLKFSYISVAELEANPDLVRTGSKVEGTAQPPQDSGWIRMVEIQDIDYQPCGGTHVNSIGEIGAVSIKKIENKGKKNRRVHLVFSDGQA